jgi:TPR repeat protein
VHFGIISEGLGNEQDILEAYSYYIKALTHDSENLDAQRFF